MRYKSTSIFYFVILLMYPTLILADNGQMTSTSPQLPPIETFLLEPIKLENVSIWVPAGKTGPLINMSCRPKQNCLYSCTLPASVHHTKTELCPNELGRLLAEYAACYHEQSLPLTIFNGWQWDYSYSLCQFESVTYDLPEHGGCWEGSWEAILTQSTGSADFRWLQVCSSDKPTQELDKGVQKTSIEVKTFDSMRTRDGYPKERKL